MFWEIVKAGLFVGSVIYQWSNAPKIKKPKPDKSKADFPRSEEGAGISVVFGYAKIDDPIVPWWKYEGSEKYEPLGVFLYYKLFATIQDIICLNNIDAIEMLFINNIPNRSNWNGNVSSPEYYGWDDNSDFVINGAYPTIGTNEYNFDATPNLGNVSLLFGGAAQTPDAFLETSDEQGTTISAYRGVVQAVYKNIIFGITSSSDIPAPQTHQYLVKRLLTQHDGTAQWYDTKAHCGYGLNVIHCIRELIISERIGAGLSSTLIDSTTFEASADTCYTEGRGVSFHINNTDTTVGELIEELLNYIQGTLYFDMSSLTFKIKLWRNDYTYATLDEITTSDVISISNINKREPSSVVNDCSVVYTDRYTFGEKVAGYKDEASINEIGRNPETIDMKWTMNPELASLIAMQTVILSSAQLTSCVLTGPLELDKYNPGDVFKVTDSRFGWNAIVFRVVEKERSELDGETISLSIIEDYFGIGLGAFGDGTITPVYTALDDVTDPVVDEMPFFLNKRIYEDPDGILGEGYAHLIAFCSNPKNYATFGIYYKVSTDSDYTNYSSGNPFITVAELDDDIGYTETTVPLVTLPIGLVSFILIDDEIMKVISSSSSPPTFTVQRGMHDTIPANHSAAAVVYIFSGYDSPYGKITEQLVIGSTYNTKLTSEALTGSQDPGEATAINNTLTNRSILPYNASGIKANGFTFDDNGVLWIGELNGTLLTWYLRNRLLQYNQWIAQDGLNLAPEAGVVFRIAIYDSTGATLKRQVLTDSNMTSVSVTNTSANSLIDPDTGTIIWFGDITTYFNIGDSVTTANCDNAGNNTTFTIANIYKYGLYTKIILDDMTGMVFEFLDGLDETISKTSAYDAQYDYTDTLETADFSSLQADKIVKITSLRPKLTSPFVFTNDDATSSITASTGTIVFVGQDLTAKVKVGYTIVLANFTEAGNNSTRVVATVSESGGDTTITVTDNTAMVDETMTGLDETLSVQDYWESWQEWELHVKRLTAPTITHSLGTPPNEVLIFSNTDYDADTYYYEGTIATSPAVPTEPDEPDTGSNEATAVVYDPSIYDNRWFKVKAYKDGQLSYTAEYKTY